jgi:hypothetical protein
MRRIKKIIFILFFVLVPIIVVWGYSPEPKQFVINQTFDTYSNPFFNYEITKYPSNVEIISESKGQKLTIGFVTDPWNLNFGILYPGSYEKRHLSISNNENNKVRVNFKVYGTVKPLISFNKNDFILLPKETVYIDIFLNTTDKTIPGNYTGEIDVKVKKLRAESLNWIL